MSKWISVDDRLPSLDGRPKHSCHVEVNVLTKDGKVTSAYWSSNQYAKTESGRIPRWERNGRICHLEITHWIPLPEPPK